MRPKFSLVVVLFIVLAGFFYLVYQGINVATKTMEPTRYFSIIDNSGTHPVDPGFLEATETSLTVDGKDLYKTDGFLIMTFYNTPVLLQVDNQDPIQVVQAVIYFNNFNGMPRVVWQTSLDAEWQAVGLDQIDKVQITP